MNLAPLACGLALALLFIIAFRTRRILYTLCCAFFLLYLLVALSQTLFPLSISTRPAAFQQGFSRGINLIPFYVGESQLDHLTRRENLLNIALTIPWGLGIGFVLPLKRRDALMAALFGGFLFEGAQLALSLFVFGYPYRTLDINDLIFNLTGAFIGYILFIIFCRLYLLAARYITLLRRAYLHAVALRMI